jgi:hypothetical protein
MELAGHVGQRLRLVKHHLVGGLQRGEGGDVCEASSRRTGVRCGMDIGIHRMV